MKDLMIDIETMGNGPDATIIQLAAVYFDRNSGKLGEEFCVNIDEQSCLEKGSVSDDSTIEWWSKQDQNVLYNIRFNAEDVTSAFLRFWDFYSPHKGVNVWSHATFDFVIVQNYLKKLFYKYMPYKSARDIRTLVDLSGIDLDRYNWKMKTHNALDDCKFQVQYCVDALHILRGPSIMVNSELSRGEILPGNVVWVDNL